MMRILADENCDRLLVAMLRQTGYDVFYVAESASGESDADLMELARVQGRLILTDHRDFGLLAERALDRPPAVLLMRLDPLSRMARVTRVVEALHSLGDTLGDELIVVEPGQIRRRTYHRRS
jgi:predicted nuclease of predicted toxin-antitoxin system